MTKEYYECHLTIDDGYPFSEKIRNAVEAIGWTFSAIDGDIALGIGTKIYATKHFNVRNGGDVVKANLIEAKKSLIRDGCRVIRAKVELVLFDERYS